MNKPQMEPVSWSYRVTVFGERRLVSWDETTGLTVGGFNSAQAMALVKMLVGGLPAAAPPPSDRPSAAPDETPPIKPARRVMKPAPLVKEQSPAQPRGAAPEVLSGLLGNPLGSSPDHSAQENVNDSADVEQDHAPDPSGHPNHAQNDEPELPLVFETPTPDPSTDSIAKTIVEGDPSVVPPENVAAIDTAIAEAEAKVSGNGKTWHPPEPGHAWGDVEIHKVVPHNDGGCLLVLVNGDRVKVNAEGTETARLEGEPPEDATAPAEDEKPKDAETEVSAIEAAQENEASDVQAVPQEILDSPKIRLLVNFFLDQGLDRADAMEACMAVKDKARSLKRKKDPRASIETCLAGMA